VAFRFMAIYTQVINLHELMVLPMLGAIKNAVSLPNIIEAGNEDEDGEFK
jgi:hypothetical protein